MFCTRPSHTSRIFLLENNDKPNKKKKKTSKIFPFPIVVFVLFEKKTIKNHFSNGSRFKRKPRFITFLNQFFDSSKGSTLCLSLHRLFAITLATQHIHLVHRKKNFFFVCFKLFAFSVADWPDVVVVVVYLLFYKYTRVYLCFVRLYLRGEFFISLVRIQCRLTQCTRLVLLAACVHGLLLQL